MPDLWIWHGELKISELLQRKSSSVRSIDVPSTLHNGSRLLMKVDQCDMHHSVPDENCKRKLSSVTSAFKIKAPTIYRMSQKSAPL